MGKTLSASSLRGEVKFECKRFEGGAEWFDSEFDHIMICHDMLPTVTELN